VLYRDFINLLAQKTGITPNQAMIDVDFLVKSIRAILNKSGQIDLGNLGILKLMPDRQGNQQITLDGKIVSFSNIKQNEKPQIIENSINSTPEITQKPSFSGPSNTIPYIDLTNAIIPPEILKIIPEKIAQKYQAVPIKLENKILTVAMIDPEDAETLELFRKSTGYEIIPNICTKNDLNHVLNQYSGDKEELEEIVKVEEPKKEHIKKPLNEELSESAPASKIVSSIIKQAVREQTSDIHIEPNEENLEVRYRLDGILRKVLTLPKEIQPAVISRIKILCNMKIDEQRMPQDGRFQTILDEKEIDFRVSTLPTVNGEKIVMRILDKTSGVLTLKDLGLRDRGYEILDSDIKKPHGMVLITGPTGSGKTTTLYAIIDQIKSDDINIVTLEDPVEYRMNGINQSQVNSEIGYTFASGLRTILRQDPNVIMLGEIRDKETAEMAVQSALTGHIVLSTLHTNDASGAIPRLIDMGIEPFLINSSINVIIAQRLCRQICKSCKQEIAITLQQIDEIKAQLGSIYNIEMPTKLYKGAGCPSCNSTGYHGRIGVFEVLPLSPEIKSIITRDVSIDKIKELAIKQGMSTLFLDGITKVISGDTTLEEVWRVTKD